MLAPVLSLFESIEILAERISGVSGVSKTYTNDSCTLEITGLTTFLRMSYDSDLPDLVSLEYTSSDIHPLSGPSLGGRSYMGIIEALHLNDGSWYLTSEGADKKDTRMLLTGEIIRDCILKQLFGNELAHQV